MSDETYSFSTAKSRLEEIVVQVRKKDTSLEKSLDLLEEGVRLANVCTELIDHADWTAGNEPAAEDGAEALAEGRAAGTEAGADPESSVAGVTAQGAGAGTAEVAAVGSEADFAPDDDAFAEAADENGADPTPDCADEDGDVEHAGDA